MTPSDLSGTPAFLRASERLSVAYRSGFTSDKQRESVAEHTWRICMMAVVLFPHFPDVDSARHLKRCVGHDLGEVIGGDVPAPEQARRALAPPGVSKAASERADLLTLIALLPEGVVADITALWDEYAAAEAPEARLAKALDKLETIMQHTQEENPAEFDYRFKLGCGREYTAGNPVIVELRRVLDEATEVRARSGT